MPYFSISCRKHFSGSSSSMMMTVRFHVPIMVGLTRTKFPNTRTIFVDELTSIKSEPSLCAYRCLPSSHSKQANNRGYPESGSPITDRNCPRWPQLVGLSFVIFLFRNYAKAHWLVPFVMPCQLLVRPPLLGFDPHQHVPMAREP